MIEEREDRPDLGPPHCTPPEGALDVELPNAAFGQGVWAIAPDCSKAVLYANVENTGIPGAQQAHWLLDVASGELTLLTGEVRSCGGCDGVFGGAWSPSGRYLMHAETYSGPGGSRIFLTDVETGETRLLADEPTTGQRLNQAGNAPSWAPGEDTVLLPAASGGSVIESVPSGDTRAFPELAWPARFDASGNYVYSGADDLTVIADAASGDILETWDGVPAVRTWEGVGTKPETVIATPDGPAAILTDSRPGYIGIVVRHPALPGDVAAFEDAARGAVWSRDGERVALARRRPTVPGQPPDDWEVAVLDVRTGGLAVLATLDAGLGPVPPKIIWNEAGTRLLVQWPGPSGI